MEEAQVLDTQDPAITPDGDVSEGAALGPVDWSGVLGGEATPSAADGFRQMDEAAAREREAGQEETQAASDPEAETAATEEAETQTETEEGAEAAEEGAEVSASDADGSDTDEQETASDALAISDLQQLFPERVIESPEDAREVITGYRERSDAFGQFEQLADQHPQLLSFVKQLMESGDPVRAALDAVEGITIEAPDPELDPEKYAEYKARKAEEKVRREYQSKEAEAAQRRRETSKQQLQSLFQDFVEGQELPDDEAREFGAQASVILLGDQETGKPRRDTFRILYNGLHHDQIVKEKTEAARKEGFAKGVRSVKKKAKGPDSPALNGSREAPDLSDEAQQMRRFAEETIPQGDVLSRMMAGGQFQTS